MLGIFKYLKLNIILYFIRERESVNGVTALLEEHLANTQTKYSLLLWEGKCIQHDYQLISCSFFFPVKKATHILFTGAMKSTTDNLLGILNYKMAVVHLETILSLEEATKQNRALRSKLLSIPAWCPDSATYQFALLNYMGDSGFLIGLPSYFVGSQCNGRGEMRGKAQCISACNVGGGQATKRCTIGGSRCTTALYA